MKRYLGDAVYVDYDGFHIVLTTEDGIGVMNCIYLERSTFHELVRYVEGLKGGGRGGVQSDAGQTAETPAAADPRPSSPLGITFPDGARIRFEEEDDGAVHAYLGGQHVSCHPSMREAIAAELLRHGLPTGGTP